jgi:transposase
MPKDPHSDSKTKVLQDRGTLNPHPEKVRDEVFLENDFFDPRDLVQTKYEMLRRARVDGCSLKDSAEAFGFSRPSFYAAQAAFAEGGLPGLIPRRRGPRGAHKLTGEVMGFVERLLAMDESIRGPALAQQIEERFGVQVHPRSIERALARRQKKRRRPARR